MRPVRPEPGERPKIKKAMRAARIKKWGWQPLSGLGLLAAIIVGVTSKWYFGVAVFFIICAPFFIFVYAVGRCPRCGQVWGAIGPLRLVASGGFAGTEEETESMVCSRCRLDIGLGLRET